ncbi:unnamed protein product [Schistocephalus solidus]|uniref:Uncharacterized protein n=1 Tax=Schistocephalus solidus TaxID=70667 RepID=A0A183SDT2_SCHSO|nr:unnamed protein product [Schistocephalus solidus]
MTRDNGGEQLQVFRLFPQAPGSIRTFGEGDGTENYLICRSDDCANPQTRARIPTDSLCAGLNNRVRLPHGRPVCGTLSGLRGHAQDPQSARQPSPGIDTLVTTAVATASKSSYEAKKHTACTADTDTDCEEAGPRSYALALRVANQLAKIAEELEAQYGQELQDRWMRTPDIWTNFAFLRSSAARPLRQSKRFLCGISVSCLALLLTSWCLVKRLRQFPSNYPRGQWVPDAVIVVGEEEEEEAEKEEKEVKIPPLEYAKRDPFPAGRFVAISASISKRNFYFWYTMNSIHCKYKLTLFKL